MSMFKGVLFPQWWGNLPGGGVYGKTSVKLNGEGCWKEVNLFSSGGISVATCNVKKVINSFTVSFSLSFIHKYTCTQTHTLPEYFFLHYWDFGRLSLCCWIQVVLQSYQWQHLTLCWSGNMTLDKHTMPLQNLDTVLKMAVKSFSKSPSLFSYFP